MPASNIIIEKKMTVSYPDRTDWRTRRYPDPDGVRLIERRAVSTESDFENGVWERESADNGITWGDWRDIYEKTFEKIKGGDEIMRIHWEPDVYDPASDSYVSCGMERFFIGDHEDAYRRMWKEAKDSFRDHCYLLHRKHGETEIKKQFVKFEDGDDFDPTNLRNPQFLERNLAYFGNIQFARNGDLLFPVCPNLYYCCRVTGIDVKDVFPSCPQLMKGMMLVRAHWNSVESRYDMTFSKPVVIGDLLSSRGVDEPTVAELGSGRIIVVFRGSNWQNGPWKTRIEPGAPGFKWYTFSDDGGKTFSPAMPWRFDSREVIYSSATLSTLWRSSKNGKLYWIGNITDPKETYGNYPRYPLYICEVDETYGFLKKDSLTVIDTRGEGDSELTQLSNFSILENRETKNLEINMTKIGQRDIKGQKHDLYSETWEYILTLPQ